MTADPQTPSTKAGRALLADVQAFVDDALAVAFPEIRRMPVSWDKLNVAILAIESEAARPDAALAEAADRLQEAIAQEAAVMGLARDGYPQGWKAEMDAKNALLCALQDTRTALDGRERPHYHVAEGSKS